MTQSTRLFLHELAHHLPILYFSPNRISLTFFTNFWLLLYGRPLSCTSWPSHKWLLQRSLPLLLRILESSPVHWAQSITHSLDILSRLTFLLKPLRTAEEASLFSVYSTCQNWLASSIQWKPHITLLIICQKLWLLQLTWSTILVDFHYIYILIRSKAQAWFYSP